MSHIFLHYPLVKDVWCHNSIDINIMVDDDVDSVIARWLDSSTCGSENSSMDL